MLKKCNKCGEEKELHEFHKNRKCKYGVDNRCASCKNEMKRLFDATDEGRAAGREYRSSDKYREGRKTRRMERGGNYKMVQSRLDSLANKRAVGDQYVSRDEAIELGLPRYNEGVVCKRGHRGERNVKNRACCECCKINAAAPDRVKKKRSYYAYNREHLVRANVANQRRRYAEDPSFKAASAIRNMLKRVLTASGEKKSGLTYAMLGYTGVQLMEHLESLFSDGMSWENYGEWHIDHIKPVSLFMKEGETRPHVVNALHNLQPLWAEDNFAKSNKFAEL